ncbi:MAG: helix-turn-helix transcriptional regulator [Betaproteobacteria bacterium]|nr:helix-turn-helix transcriptional regulator [Betaproteobacteria bacterium]
MRDQHTDGTMERLIGNIYDAGLNDERWQEVFDTILKLTRSHAGQLFTPEALSEADGGIALAKGLDPSLFPDYAADYFRHDLWKQRVVERGFARTGCTYTDAHLVDEAEWQRSEFWNGFLKRQELYRLCGGVVHDGSDSSLPLTALACYRDPRAQPFGAKEQRIVAKVLPHLRRSLAIRAKLHPARQSPAALALDVLGLPVLVLARDARLLFANAAAAELLTQGGVVSLRLGRLVLADGTGQRELDELLAHANTGFRQMAPRSCSLALGNPLAGGLVLSLMPVGRLALQGMVAGGAAAIAFLSRTDRPLPLDAGLARAVYGLTWAEAALAVALAQGQSLEQHATTRGVSIHTARSQLRSVFEKTGVSRQSELIRALLAVAVPLLR